MSLLRRPWGGPSRRESELARLAAGLGWASVAPVNTSLAFAGQAAGVPFEVRSVLWDDADGALESIECGAGERRLEFMVAACRTRRPSAEPFWLHDIEWRPPRSADGPSPEELRAALNERAKAGASVAELNAFALSLGAGGVTGVVERFRGAAVAVEAQEAGLPAAFQAIALNCETARAVFDGEPAEGAKRLVAEASSGGNHLRIFARVPFTKVHLECPSVSFDQVRAVVDLACSVQRRSAAAGRPTT